MYYPWLDVPFLTSPMIIAAIALFHVFVSHYAVGGGLLLARENSRALRKGDVAYRQYWKKHAKFFILLTVPYGAITGVGIWLTIGLASPLATETLIRTFVFGWAIEWCFFLLEIVSGFAFYYFWDQLGRKASSFAGWIYALSAWISLVLITGITSFMLNSVGLIEDWESTGNFWHAFLNVQFLPQTVARTGCALTLGTFYVMVHASVQEKNLDIREQVVKRMRAPAFVGILLLAFGVAGWLFFLPESSRLTLERAAATNIFAGLFVAILAGITLLLLVGPCARPRETSLGAALALLLMGIAGVGVAEFVREAVRKPYVVDRIVYGNQIYRQDVARLREFGLLYSGTWTALELDKLQEKYPDLKISRERYLNVPSSRLEPPTWFSPAREADEPNESETIPASEDSLLEESTPDGGGETTDDALSQSSSHFYLNTVAYQQSLQDGASRFSPVATPIGNAPLDPSSNTLPSASTSNAVSPTQPSSLGSTNLGAAPSSPIPSTPANVNDALSHNEQGKSELVDDPPHAESMNGSLFPSTDEAPAEIVSAKSPAELDLEINGPISRGNEDLLKVEQVDRLALGRMVFLHHCNGCHAADHGYSAVAPMVSGKSATELSGFVLRLNHSHFYMPPWSGVEVEAELLGEYLEKLGANVPNNVFMKDKPRKENAKETTKPESEGEQNQDPVQEEVENGSADLTE